MSKGRERHAEKSLKLFRGVSCDSQRDDVEHELQELSMQIFNDRSCRTKNEGAFTVLRQPDVYKPLFLMIGFFFFQQASGIFVLIVYATKFAQEAKVAMPVFLCAVLIGVVRVLATGSVALVLDKFGRKPPTLLSGVSMSICMFGLALYNFLGVQGWDFLPSFLLFVFIITSTIGFHAVPFAMNAEIFPRKARGLACGLTVGLGYFLAFVAIKTYPLMVERLSSWMIFAIYGSFALLGTVFVKFFIIETKGKSLKEIEEHFRGKNPETDALNTKVISFIANKDNLKFSTAA